FSGNPFRLSKAAAPALLSETPPDAAETTLDLTLHGAWADPEGGSAIIKTPDGKQKRFSVGETICCGATLERVYGDQVTILRGGVREALRLPRNIPQAGAAPASAAVEVAPEAAPTVAGLTDVVQIEVDKGASGSIRLRLYSGADDALFEGLGLRNGDSLVSINGEAAPTDLNGFAALMERLTSVTSASVIVEREGVRMPLEISLPGGVAPEGQ
ncbi:MAG: type II secretion system protein N, partial [Parvularculaceae bacterium]